MFFAAYPKKFHLFSLLLSYPFDHVFDDYKYFLFFFSYFIVHHLTIANIFHSSFFSLFSIFLRASLLYFVMADLGSVNSMYQYSLPWFSNLFVK